MHILIHAWVGSTSSLLHTYINDTYQPSLGCVRTCCGRCVVFYIRMAQMNLWRMCTTVHGIVRRWHGDLFLLRLRLSKTTLTSVCVYVYVYIYIRIQSNGIWVHGLNRVKSCTYIHTYIHWRARILQIDLYIVVFFTAEYLLRFLVNTRKLNFVKQPMNVVDLISVR